MRPLEALLHGAERGPGAVAHFAYVDQPLVPATQPLAYVLDGLPGLVHGFGRLPGRLLGLACEVAHLLGHHRKAAPVFPGACRLDRGVQGQEIGLSGDSLDGLHEARDPLAGGFEPGQGVRRLPDILPELDQELARAAGAADVLSRPARQLPGLARRFRGLLTPLAPGAYDVVHRTSRFQHQRTLLLGLLGECTRTRSDLPGGHLHLLRSHGELLGHRRESAGLVLNVLHQLADRARHAVHADGEKADVIQVACRQLGGEVALLHSSQRAPDALEAAGDGCGAGDGEPAHRHRKQPLHREKTERDFLAGEAVAVATPERVSHRQAEEHEPRRVRQAQRIGADPEDDHRKHDESDLLQRRREQHDREAVEDHTRPEVPGLEAVPLEQEQKDPVVDGDPECQRRGQRHRDRKAAGRAPRHREGQGEERQEPAVSQDLPMTRRHAQRGFASEERIEIRLRSDFRRRRRWCDWIHGCYGPIVS